MDIEWTATAAGEVTLVSVVGTNEYDEPARFRVVNRLHGPVWPPRRGGQPAAGWDEDGYEGVVDPGDQIVLGYATPAEPRDPPVELARVEPAGPTSDTPGPADVVRTFDDGRPPRSVLSPTPSIARDVRLDPGSTPQDGPGDWP